MVEMRDERLGRPDGRTVAWAEWGPADGEPVLRLPGTPGSRYSVPTDQAHWAERGLCVITVERPGFGASTRLPGRGFAEHADDIVAILDHLGIERLPVYGGSGAAPHELALAARHPDRVTACSVIDGAAPLTDEEVREQVDFNVASDELARAGDRLGLRVLLDAARTAIIADPIAGFGEIMETAPEEDRAIIADPAWQAGFGRGLGEALAPGVDGWVDEALALDGDWADIDLGAVTTSVTWWHSDSDRNCPISSAERLVGRLPNARLVVWPGGGHLTGYRLEPEILDELLERAGARSRLD